MICNKCGHPINSDDIYCRFCGNKIGKITKCVVCNSDILSDSQVCPVCGSKQSDYIKCGVCNEVNKSSNKYCTGCGNLLTSTVPPKEEEEITTQTQSNFNIPIVVVACIFVGIIALIGSLIFSGISSSFTSKFISNIKSSINSINIKRDDIPDIDIDEELENEEIENNEKNDEESNKEKSTPKHEEKEYTYYTLEFVDTIKVREEPSTKAKQVGKISKGSTKIGFSVCENEGYYWYQIGSDEWVANDGTFLYAYEFKSNEDYNFEYYDSAKVNVTSDTGIYEGPGYDYNCTGWLISTSKFIIFESIQNDNGEYWLKISPCEYVPYSNVEYIYD